MISICIRSIAAPAMSVSGIANAAAVTDPSEQLQGVAPGTALTTLPTELQDAFGRDCDGADLQFVERSPAETEPRYRNTVVFIDARNAGSYDAVSPGLHALTDVLRRHQVEGAIRLPNTLEWVFINLNGPGWEHYVVY